MVGIGRAGSQSGRKSGSPTEFADDWRRARIDKEGRYLIFPAWSTSHQADLFEWIKVQRIQRLLAEAGITQGSILEYGCGAAGISLYLARSGYRAHICDRSPDAIEVAKLNQSVHAPTCQLTSAVVSDGMFLPYADDSFDVVMSYGLLEHFEAEPLGRLIDETLRVLRPGGLYLADIVPGLGQLNVRTLGVVASYLGSVTAHLVQGRWQVIPSLYKQYFSHYFESAWGDDEWLEILRGHHLQGVRVEVCRPFPPLALPGSLDRAYTSLIRRFLGFHRRFDGANTWLTRRWGWMYLVSGWKP